jgi:hypothetical protein
MPEATANLRHSLALYRPHDELRGLVLLGVLALLLLLLLLVATPLVLLGL